MENNKTQAEIYREERKERLAKAAAKQAKKSPKLSKSKKIAGKVIAILLAVVVALGAIGGVLNFFGTPQKVLKVSVGDSDYSFTIAEFNYYYYNTWYNYQSTAYQYESYYGEGMGASLLGYDYTKAPTEQEYTDDMAAMTGVTLQDLGNPEKATWADAFTYAAIGNIAQIKFGADKAKEAGLTLTEEQEKEIDDYIEEARETAKQSDYSLDRWLHSQIGKGISEKLVLQIQTETRLATIYFEKLEKDTTNAITDAEIKAEYEKNPDLYDILSARVYTVSPVEADVKKDATEEEKKAAEDKAAKATKEKADKIFNAIADEESFVKEAQKAILDEDSKSTIKAEESTKAENIGYADLETVSEDIAKWAYDDARKVGDKKCFENGDGSYTIILLTELPHKDIRVSSSDVRHILVKFDEKKDDDGKAVALTDVEIAKYKADAQLILDEFRKNPTEENFVALTKKYTDDVDSNGNPNNDGLYENVADDGQYVEAFTKWAIDSNRKPGDTGIVQTEYGFHVMYYVEGNGDAWYASAKNGIFTERYAAVTDDLIAEIMKDVDIDNAVLNWAEKNQNKFIARIVMGSF